MSRTAGTASVLARVTPGVVIALLVALFLTLPAGAAGSGASPDPAPQGSSHKAVDSSTRNDINQPAPDAAPSPARNPEPTAAPGSGRHSSASPTVAPGSSPSVDLSSTHSGATSTGSRSGSPGVIARAPSAPAAHPTKLHRALPAVKHRTTQPGKSGAQGSTAATPVDISALLARRLDVLQPATGALTSLSHHDGTLLLLGSVAMLVLLVASSSLLRLLARGGREGWEA